MGVNEFEILYTVKNSPETLLCNSCINYISLNRKLKHLLAITKML